ncbi:unnamed protein product [Symbiodinium sp. CCMP2456]|nr:unnamed protein product [Symbiodinium sp. CCMP2456]
MRMTDADDGAQEIGRALREQGRQVPERYAQLQASLDQARPVSVDGRGLSAPMEDQTSAEQGWAILTSGALHRHRQGRARAMLRGIFKDGKKGRKEAAEHEEARQKRLETVRRCQETFIAAPPQSLRLVEPPCSWSPQALALRW